MVPPSALVRDSEYLETHLVAVPLSQARDFLRSYETLAPFVVPRSSTEVARDDEFVLYAVTTFKKHSPEFVHGVREKRWTPRDFKFVDGGGELEKKEVEDLRREERKVWGEALRLGRTGYSEGAMIWVHVLTLRVFVETVLRYGLPLEFVCGLVQVRFRALPIVIAGNDHTNKLCRPRRSCRRKSRANWTPAIRIWEAMLLAGIRRVELSRTIPAFRLICKLRAAILERITRRMYSTSSRFYSARGLAFVMYVYDCRICLLWLSLDVTSYGDW